MVIFRPGSVVQVTVACICCLIYLLVQLEVKPSHQLSDDFVSISASFLLAIILFCCLVMNIGVLVGLPEIKDRMPTSLVSEFDVPTAALGVVILCAVLAAIVSSMFVVARCV